MHWKMGLCELDDATDGVGGSVGGVAAHADLSLNRVVGV